MDMEKDIPTVMEEFYSIVNEVPSTEAAELLVHKAGAMPSHTAITALARLLVLSVTRSRYGRTKSNVEIPAKF